MKIRFAILEQDASYLKRIVSVFSTKYGDKFEMYSFTDQAVAMAALEEAKIDVLVADDAFEVDTAQLPRRCAFAYLVESADIESLRGRRVIFKYQRAEMIYKQVLSLYADNASDVSGLKTDESACRLILFGSPCGGVGTSSMAAACALRYAGRGKRVLYINLEKFGSAASFFTGEGQFDMSDVAFAVKSRKVNLALKLESFQRRDSRGVSFFAPSKVALDMMELGAEDARTILTELQSTGQFDCIIADVDFALDKATLDLGRAAHALVWVSDGSQVANDKIDRAFAALSILEQNADSPLFNRVRLIYNRFSSKTGAMLPEDRIKCLGGAPRYENGRTDEVVQKLSGLAVLDSITV